MQRVQAAGLRWSVRVSDATALCVTFFVVIALRERLGEGWGLGPQHRINLQNQVQLLIQILPIWLLSLHSSGTYNDLRRVRRDVLLLRLARAVGIAAVLLTAVQFVFPPASPTSRSFVLGYAVASTLALFLARLVRLPGERPSDILVVGGAEEVLPFLEILDRHRDWGLRVAGVVRPDEEALLADSPVPRGRGPGASASVLEERPHPRACVGAFSAGSGAAAPFPPGTQTREPALNARTSSGVQFWLPAGAIPVVGTVSDLPRILDDGTISQVFMTGRAWDTRTLRAVADACETVGVTFSMDANFLGFSIAQADLLDYDGWGVLSFSSTPRDAEALVVKRMLDVVGSLCALTLMSPVLALVALAIKLEDGGPVIFSQERTGLYGHTFRMYKFRSMVPDAEAKRGQLADHNEMSGPVFKMARDPRVTRIGRWIRLYSLDEFPQFWNVLRGEMSLVGPRPPIPSEVVHYERWQMRRLSMKPGLTCIWQVSGRNHVDFESWMRLDLQYIDTWSLFLDIVLLAKTVPVVLSGRGAR